MRFFLSTLVVLLIADVCVTEQQNENVKDQSLLSNNLPKVHDTNKILTEAQRETADEQDPNASKTSLQTTNSSEGKFGLGNGLKTLGTYMPSVPTVNVNATHILSKVQDGVSATLDATQLNSAMEQLRQNMPNLPNLNLSQLSASRQGPCACGGGQCACCADLRLNLMTLKPCVNVTYDPDEFSFAAKIVVNERVLYKRTISGKNPRPICVPLPQVPAIRACIRLYNIYFQERNVHACINMEGKLVDITLFKVGMDCLRLGQNGLAIVKPEDGGGLGHIDFFPSNPNKPGDSDDKEDEYDYDGDSYSEEEDEDEDEGDFDDDLLDF